jgi:hypothetical protein
MFDSIAVTIHIDTADHDALAFGLVVMVSKHNSEEFNTFDILS